MFVSRCVRFSASIVLKLKKCETSSQLMLSAWTFVLNGRSLSELHYQTASQKALIRESCDYLEAHIFDSSLTVGKLIDISGLSGTYFRKIFSGVCGMSPQKYIESKRLTQAKAIFDSRDFSSVREVAESVGYADPLYFGKLFRKQYGVPPSEYLRSLALTPLSK